MSVIIDRVRKRLLERNKNWLCVICGATGSGKSYSALKLAERICPERFGIDNVVFSADGFMDVLNSKRLRRGDVVVWDEAGVGVPAKEWYSLSNRMINYVVQTFRRDNIAVVFTTPNLSFIDRGIRVLFHAFIQTISINRKNGFVITKFKNIDCNPQTDKMYFKYPVVVENRRLIKINPVCFFMPSARLVKNYEYKKKLFTDNLKHEIGDEVKRSRFKHDVVKVVDLDNAVSEIVTRRAYYVKVYNGRSYVNLNLVCADYGIGAKRGRIIKARVEKLLKL